MRSSSSLLLRVCNFLSGTEASSFLADALHINLLEVPVDRLAVLIAFCVLILAGGILGGWALFCNRPAISAERRRFVRRRFPGGQHTVLLGHECYKVFFTAGGLAVLAALCAVQFFSCRSFYIRQDVEEYYYKYYSSMLSGEPTEEKTACLADEAARFEELWAEYAQYAEAVEGDGTALELLTGDLADQLRAEYGFQRAWNQYVTLREGQSYVYATGWPRECSRCC